jgi:hypothetical protein
MPALRRQQGYGFGDKAFKFEALWLQFSSPAETEELLEVHFHEGELAKSHFEGFGIAASGMLPKLKLHGEAGTSDAVAQLMRQAATYLAKEPNLLGFAHGLLKLSQALGHVVDGLAQVAKLVIAVGQGHGAEVAAGYEARASLKLQDTATEPLAQPHRQDD